MILKFLLHVLIVASLYSCTGIKNNEVSNQIDPYENLNRNVFKFNQKFDKYILEPISIKYRNNLPKRLRVSISDHLDWISTPGTILNSSFQLEGKNLASSTLSFLLNSLTLGFYDLDEKETEFHKLDFGSTLAKYNFSEGNYLIIPFLGPNTTRDFTGSLIGRFYFNQSFPDNFNTINNYEIPIKAVNERTNYSNAIEDINTSSDPYIKMRSFYLQRRRKNILINDDYEMRKNIEEDKEFEKLLQ